MHVNPTFGKIVKTSPVESAGTWLPTTLPLISEGFLQTFLPSLIKSAKVSKSPYPEG